MSFVALIRSAGYRPTRYFFEMLKGDLEFDRRVATPAGLELRPVVKADMRRIFDAEAEAFRDHWGRRELDRPGSFASSGPIRTSISTCGGWPGTATRWPAWSRTSSSPTRSRPRPARGWLDHVSVRRPWRRRGLASALILSACVALRERGMTEAALGVDSESLSGALGLYERLGFAQSHRSTIWRRTLRQG